MVFESLVVDVLNRILGDYVQNLDSKQLSIGIWGGDVVLENLVLKQTALDDLNLPIQTVYGQLGKLVLKIPWKNLYGAPVEAAIERLYLLVVPNNSVKYDPEKENKITQDAKQADLLRIETARKKAETLGQKKEDDTFVEKLTTQIIKNVQIKIKNIHIRYEDNITNPGKPFALGITLSNLSVHTTNGEWKPAIVNSAVSQIFKVLDLDAFAVYWNSFSPKYATLPPNELIKHFENEIATRDEKPSNYTYILGPINSSARLRLNPKPENDEEPFSISKILLNLEMEKLAVGLTKSQYRDIMILAESMDRMSRGIPYRKYRPFVSTYKGHYKEWWKFAYQCILESEVRRNRRNWNWNHIKQHRELCKVYGEAYQFKLQNKKIPQNLQQTLTEGEKILDLTNLVIIRQRMQLEVERIAKSSITKKQNSSWFASWWGKSASNEDIALDTATNIMKKFEEAMTSDEKMKLYQAIDYQENSAPAEYPEKFVSTFCAFVLRCLELQIRDDTSKTNLVLTVELKGVNCRLQQRPAANALQVAVKIDQFSVLGVTQNSIIPQLVSSEDFSEGGVLLDVLFETNPLDHACDQRLIIKSLPLRVVYDSETINQLSSFFKMPNSLELDQLQAAAGIQLANFKEMSATGMQNVVEKQSILDLDIHLSAPYIIIPYRGFFEKAHTILVINLGTLSVKSVPRNPLKNVHVLHKSGSTEAKILEEIMSSSYDKFIIDFSEVQILICDKTEKWRTCILEKVISPMHVLQPLNLTVSLDKCILTDDPRLPKLKIAGELPSITLNLCENRVFSLIELASSIEFPEAEVPEPSPISRISSKSSISSLVDISLRKSTTKIKSDVVVEDFVQIIDMDVKFEMKELVINVSKNSVKMEEPQKLIQFRCMMLELGMIAQPFNSDIMVRLGGIGLTHYRNEDSLQIINTPMTEGLDEYLFTIKYAKVLSTSPEFHTKYNSCEQCLNLDFTSLQLQLHQQGLQELLQFSNEFSTKIEQNPRLSKEKSKIATTTSKYKISKQLSVIEEFGIKPRPVHRRSAKKYVETIMMKLIVNVNEVDLLIANDVRHLCSFSVSGIKTEIIVKKSYTQISALLTDITVLDLNPSSVHSKILCRTNKENAIDIQVVLYNIEKNEYNMNNLSLKVKMSGLRITFLNLFVTTMMNFMNEFLDAQKTIADASAAAAETAKTNMQTAFENAIRIDMNIKIKAPVIIMPTNSTSYDAIMLDLGDINLTNHFIDLDVKNEMGRPAVIDELKLHLTDLKCSRLLLDSQLNNKSECILLKPVSCTLKIRRNLSSSWYNNVPDLDIAGEMKSIELMVSEVDYTKVLLVLSENLNEQASDVIHEETKNITELVHMPDVEYPKKRKYSSYSEGKVQKQPYVFLRFTFTMESLIVNLFKGHSRMLTEHELTSGQSFHPAENGLARFTLLVLSIKGRILSDNSISTSVLLVDCLLDDTRAGREGTLTRLMERKEEHMEDITNSPSTTKSESGTRSMIDITYQQRDNDMFVDVRVYSFNLVLSIDYLMKIATFFTPEFQDPEASNKSVKYGKKGNDTKSTKSTSTDNEQLSKSITINLKIEQPDIILVERMDSIDTYALILNNEVLLNVRLADSNQIIRGSINDLQLYMCCYNPAKRNDTKCPVLRPCNIVVVGTTPQNQGLHLDITMSDISLSISPAIIELLSSIQKTVYASVVAVTYDSEELKYYSDIWDYKPLKDSDYWYLKTEEGQDVIKSLNEGISLSSNKNYVLSEVCNVAPFAIYVSIEAGIGNKTLPMLLLKSKFDATVHNWSSNLYIDSTLSTQITYYNSRLAVWEPLLETVEIKQDNKVIHTPWELKIELRKNEPDEQSVSSPQSEVDVMEEITFKPPIISIYISSSVNMELVVTKTLLELLTNLGNSFTKAMTDGIPIKEVNAAPYRIKNDSGLQITVLLENNIFKLHNQDHNSDYKEIILESGTEVHLDLKETPDGIENRLFNKSMSEYTLSHSLMENIINIKVNKTKSILHIPILRADKRYFTLNHREENRDNWGLISDITVDGAETIITLRSILQVHNHFNQPVNMYYMTNRGNELEIIKQIPPNGSCNLPMNAVYTMTNELFFSVQGHSVTAAPYVWKDLQHNLSMVKTLTCPSDTRNDNQIFVMKVCGDIEQIYFENTTKHTMSSTCYNIHLRPAVTFKNCLPIPVVCIIQGDVTEITVQPGDQLHMPTVNPGSSYIVVRLLNYLEKDWSCKRDILSNPPEFAVWQFESYDSIAKMALDLGMHFVNKSGTIEISLYCPFWMLNKTGLMLSYRNSDDSVNILHHPEDFNEPILFSFNAKNFFGKKKAAIRIQSGEWSDKFSLDVAGSAGIVVCKANNIIHQIGVHNQLTYNGLTKQITFTPYFVLINNAPFAIECQELERPADPWITVDPNTCKPLWPRSERDDKLLKVRIRSTVEISAPFLITEVHTILLKLPNKYGGVNVDVQVTEGGTYITMSQYKPGLAPALIVNHTSQEMHIWEKESINVKKLMPKHKFLFSWGNPTGPRLLLWEIGKKKDIEDDLRKDGLGEFTINNTNIYWVSFLDGMQRVLLFTEDLSLALDAESAGDLENVEQEITVSIYGIGISVVNNLIRQEIMYIGIASSGVIWETCKLSSKRFKQLSVKESALIEAAYREYLNVQCPTNTPYVIDVKTEIDFKNEMMLRPHKRRIRRVFQTGLWFQMKTSINQMQIHAKINRVQIDNQMYDCIFPVILAPVPPPKSVAADSALKPFAELSIVQRIMKHSTVQQYKYYKVLIQEFHIKVDLGFVNAVMAVFQAKETSEEEEKELFLKDKALVNEPLMAHVSTQSLQEQKNFYDLLHFSPLKIHVSFSLATAPGSTSSSNTPAFINVLLQGLGVTLTDMQDVVFRLAYFEREYSFLTQKQLMSEATSHYVGQAVKQLYVLVLGLDVIGNPYGLVLGISKGVEDLFYEPFQGAIQGPGEFAEGLVLGVRSLFGHTVGGAAGAVSKITGAMGKGLAALTFDKDYQRKRRDQINKKPANIQEGIARGGKGLVMGVVDGVTGVFTKPISGAKEQGVEGFFKGLGKGAVGLVTRPTAGVIDFASGSLDAVKRATEMGDDVTRLRAPRYLRADGLVRPYIKQEADGNKLLRELEKGKYANTDVYAYHMWIIEGKDILLLTDKRMAYVVHNDIFGGWQVEWSYTWSDLPVAAKVVDRGIQIQTGESKKKVLGLFGSSDNGKIIIIADPERRQFVKDIIETLRQNA